MKAGPSQSEIRAWARAHGIDVNPRGSVAREVVDAYRAAHTVVTALNPRPVPGGIAAAIEKQWADDYHRAALTTLNAEADGEPDIDDVAAREPLPAEYAESFNPPLLPAANAALVEENQQLRAHIEYVTEERDTAHIALAIALQKWNTEERRANALAFGLSVEQEASGDLRREVVALRARSWWKRVAR